MALPCGLAAPRSRRAGKAAFVPLVQLVPGVGKKWRGRGTAFSTPGRQVAGTLLGWWGTGHKTPWLILSDLAPQQGKASWYGLRGWIEQGIKDSKRGGWQWQHTRMEDPQRAGRLWLAMAVTTLWLSSPACRLRRKPDRSASVGSHSDRFASHSGSLTTSPSGVM